MSDLPNKPHLSVKEVAEHYGISPKTLYLRISLGDVPAEKIAGSNVLRIRREVAEQLGKPAEAA